jgi:hypothetical protein
LTAALQDQSAWKRDASVSGSASVITDGTRGKALQLSSAARVDLPAFAAPASYTKAAWIRRSDVTTGGAILSSTAALESLSFAGGTITLAQAGGAVTGAWPGGNNQWHHLAATYDDETGEAVIYVDGEAAGEGTLGARTLSNLHAVGYGGGNGFGGAINDIRLIARALGADEIKALYRATRL